MWKKILYYALMIIFGIVFMLMILVSVVTSTEMAYIKKSVTSGDYSNALKVYTSYSNTNALYDSVADTDANCEVRVFELAYTNIAAPTTTKYSYMDIEYGVALERLSMNMTNPSASSQDGTVINESGYVITNSLGEVFKVYDNGYVDGNATAKQNAYLVEDSNGSKTNLDGEEYGIIDINNNYYSDIYMFYIPKKLLTMYSGFTLIDIKSIDIIDRDGNTFTSISFDEALNYNDSYLNKVAEMTEYYNAGVDKEDFTEYNDMYDSWEEEYLAIDGANTYLRSKDIYNGVVWFKIIGSLVLYTLFVLIVGDIVVGKRRIIALFQRIGNRGNNGGSFVQPTGSGRKATDAPDLMNDKVIDTNKGDKK